jgi:hypothetical protein
LRKQIVIAAAAIGSVVLGGASPAVAKTGCPALLPYEANPIGPSVAVVLRTFKASDKPLVTGALTAPSDPNRGPEATRACGARVSARTVVVSVTQQSLLPSASLSERVFFVGRTKAGYRIWQTVR